MYNLVIHKQVIKDLKKIDKTFADIIISKIELLPDDPFPGNSRKIVNSDMTYRLRVNDYRIIYQVDKKNKEISILYIRHRKDAYKK